MPETSRGRAAEGDRTIHAAQFITPVPAVVLLVTLATPVDAGAVIALKLIGATGGVSWRVEHAQSVCESNQWIQMKKRWNLFCNLSYDSRLHRTGRSSRLLRHTSSCCGCTPRCHTETPGMSTDEWQQRPVSSCHRSGATRLSRQSSPRRCRIPTGEEYKPSCCTGKTLGCRWRARTRLRHCRRHSRPRRHTRRRTTHTGRFCSETLRLCTASVLRERADMRKTSEQGGSCRFSRWGKKLTTADFISSILTVSFSVAAPHDGYTLVHTVCTAELRHSAGFGHWKNKLLDMNRLQVAQ